MTPAGVAQAPATCPGWKTFGSIAVLGTVCTAVAYLIFFTIIARAGAGYAALVTYLVPPVALGYGAIFLDEGVGAAALIGLVLILAGVTLGTRRAVRAPRPAAATRVTTIETATIGDAWLETARAILRDGADAVYDGEPTKELALVAIHVAAPDPDDATIARLADPEWLDWMRRNFTEPDDVAELGGARSYARRLRDYGGRDQVAWVIERLADPECRSAAITTFEPHTDTTYVPCISLLDFWRVSGPLELVVYAHSLDFGKKAYGNLVELARLQHEVADAVGCAVGSLVVHAKSAHVYEPELALMAELSA